MYVSSIMQWRNQNTPNQAKISTTKVSTILNCLIDRSFCTKNHNNKLFKVHKHKHIEFIKQKFVAVLEISVGFGLQINGWLLATLLGWMLDSMLLRYVVSRVLLFVLHLLSCCCCCTLVFVCHGLVSPLMLFVGVVCD